MKNIKLNILVLLVLSFISCEFDEVPTGQIVLKSAITDRISAENALNGVYYRFAGGGKSFFGHEEINWTSNNEIVPAQLAGVLYYRLGLGSGANNIYMNNVSSTDRTVSRIWESRYQTIAAANGVLDRVPQLADSEFKGNRKNEILGEAKFLRAYANFSLLCYYGKFYDNNNKDGIILRKSLTKSDEIVISRSTVAECYKTIIKDLDFAIANCPKTNQKQYATTWAAKLLKARVLLYRGINTDYQDANALALDVINKSSFKLDNLKKLFELNGKNSTEIILSLVPGENQTYHLHFYIVGRRPKRDAVYLATKEFVKFVGTDPRAKWLLGYGPQSLDLVRNGMKPLGFSVIKYYDISNKKPVEDSYALRLTEAYLIAAETSARLGDLGNAKTYLKSVLKKGGVTDMRAVDAANTEGDFLYQIFREYTINMCFEDGYEWFAILRCLPFKKVQEIRPGIKSKNQYILPIPVKELRKNALMTQNTGYPDE